MKNQEHHFNIEEAIKYGIEKAILLNNLRFWLEKNKANEKHKYKHTDGKEYYWTFNSSQAFFILFPYMPRRSISRYLSEMEKDNIILVGNYNKKKYDKTRWYSMAEFEAEYSFGVSVGQNGQWIGQNGQPIPYIPPSKKQDLPFTKMAGGEFSEKKEKAGTPETNPSSSLSQIKKKPNQLWEVMEWAEKLRGKQFVNRGKQLKAIKMLKEAEVSIRAIKDRWSEMEEDKFWGEKGFDFKNLVDNFDKKI